MEHNGKRYHVTVNEYLGRVDETTGEVISIKNRSSAASSIDSADLKTKWFGSSYVLLEITTPMGLRDDRKRAPVTSVLQSLDNIRASRINGI